MCNKFFLFNVQVLKLDKSESWRVSLLARNRQSFGPRRERPQYLHMAIGTVIALLVYPLLYGVLEGSVLISIIPIILFNFLYVSTIFPLDGSLWRKVCLLLFGNIIGWAWNFIESSFATIATYYFGDAFNIVHVIAGPIVNSIWIVSIWSLGLSTLSSEKP